MFTGIIESLGVLEKKEKQDGKLTLAFSSQAFSEELSIGESIAVDGVCLSVVAQDKHSFSVQLSSHSLSLTLFNDYPVGQIVNLERSLKFSDRLSGHIVQGHVDGIVEILELKNLQDSYWITFSCSAELRPYISRKGSLALNGISLTVAALKEESFSVAIIPITWEKTNIQQKKVGSRLHLETDLLSRYLESLLKARGFWKL